jgi:hypothetical protein
MVADYFTKPLQGVLFYKFRDQIMGLVPMDTIIGDHRSALDNNLDVEFVTPPITGSRTSATQITIAQPKHQTAAQRSWSNVVRSRPVKGLKASLQTLAAR